MPPQGCLDHPGNQRDTHNMTTQLSKDASPRLPKPSEYTHYSNRVLSHARPALPRRLLPVAFALLLFGAGMILLLFTGCATPRPVSPVYPTQSPQIGATDSYLRPINPQPK